MANNESGNIDGDFQKQLLDLMQKQMEAQTEKIQKQMEAQTKQMKKQMKKQNKKLDRIEIKLKKLEKKQRYLMDRNSDRDRSLHYLSHYQTSLPSKEQSHVIDNGTSFNAGPDDMVPEHPFIK